MLAYDHPNAYSICYAMSCSWILAPLCEAIIHMYWKSLSIFVMLCRSWILVLKWSLSCVKQLYMATKNHYPCYLAACLGLRLGVLFSQFWILKISVKGLLSSIMAYQHLEIPLLNPFNITYTLGLLSRILAVWHSCKGWCTLKNNQQTLKYEHHTSRKQLRHKSLN